MMRAVLFALFALLYAGAALAQQQSGGGGLASPTTSPSGPVTVGTVLTTAPVPAGATCQWTRDGSNIGGATTCGSYTTVTADGGHTVADAITLVGVAVNSPPSNSGAFFFPFGTNIMHIGLVF